MNVLYKYAYMWEEIGTALNFRYNELQSIKNSSRIASPQQHLNQLLDEWTQWPNSSHHEVPTLKSLCDALRSDALGLTAEANKLHERRYSLPSQLYKVNINKRTSIMNETYIVCVLCKSMCAYVCTCMHDLQAKCSASCILYYRCRLCLHIEKKRGLYLTHHLQNQGDTGPSHKIIIDQIILLCHRPFVMVRML